LRMALLGRLRKPISPGGSEKAESRESCGFVSRCSGLQT
jgi:hypothetical protein